MNRTLLSERDWQQIRPCHRQCKPKFKKNKINFRPFGTKKSCYKKKLIAECGRRQITTIVYVVAGEKQSLLGLADTEVLGIMQITSEGQLLVRQLTGSK